MCFSSSEEAVKYIDSHVDGETVGFGGSVTLEQIGLYEALSKHNTVYWHQRIPDGKTSREVRLKANASNIYISSVNALAETGDCYTYFTKQGIFAVIGIAGMWFVSKIDYRIYKRFYWPIYFLSVGVLLLVLVPGLGSTGGGAKRWINLGFTQFQPSEITKIGMIIFYAGYLTDHKEDLRNFKKGFIIPLLYILPPVAIALLIQNHLSVGIVMSAITFVMMIMAGCRLIYFIVSGLIKVMII